MSAPIDLAELRARANDMSKSGEAVWAAYRNIIIRDYRQAVTPGVVLALVEAVEAAQAVASHSPLVVDSEAHEKLRAALAAFAVPGEPEAKEAT